MKPLYIFDLDGTLADASHRMRHIQGATKDWKAFFAAAAGDAPIQSTITTLRCLQEYGAETWIWTGRSDEVRVQTYDWLVRYRIFDYPDFGPGNRLRMRRAGDHRPDTVLKAQWLDELPLEDRRRIVAVFEDRGRVVEMWRSRGLAAYQVAPGEF